MLPRLPPPAQTADPRTSKGVVPLEGVVPPHLPRPPALGVDLPSKLVGSAEEIMRRQGAGTCAWPRSLLCRTALATGTNWEATVSCWQPTKSSCVMCLLTGIACSTRCSSSSWRSLGVSSRASCGMTCLRGGTLRPCGRGRSRGRPSLGRVVGHTAPTVLARDARGRQREQENMGGGSWRWFS